MTPANLSTLEWLIAVASLLLAMAGVSLLATREGAADDAHPHRSRDCSYD
jgi:hypothetical protein